MNGAEQISQKNTNANEDYRFSIKALSFFGFLMSSAMALFYVHSQSTSLETGKLAQKSRAEHLSAKLDDFSSVANFLSRFVQENINGKKLSKSEIESRLSEYLRSAPEATIYGVGLWFEPFQFDSKLKYFGPYVHRNEKTKIELTYEWNTPTYNYHEQAYYKIGRNAAGEGVFVDPYFDSGLVYVTVARAFFNSKREILGVISVDMILPQLQSLIEESNSSEKEVIYITSREGQLLAHPQKEQFINQWPQKTATTSLMDFKISDLDQDLKNDRRDWITNQLEVPLLGWKLVVTSAPEFLMSDLQTLRRTLWASFFSLWGLIAILMWIVRINYQQKSKFESSLEHGRMQLVQTSKMAALGEMAGGIAHEINNPLAIIMGKADQILRQIKTDRIDLQNLDVEINKIKATALRIAKTVSGLRNFSRSADNDSFEFENVITIVNDIEALCSEKLKSGQVQFGLENVPDLVFECRSTQIVQVLVNLINNAYDAISDLPEKWIRLEAKELNADEIQFIVTDSGTGIPSEIAEKMMLPFFTTKEVGKGTGLGLSISLGIVESHKGRLEINSKFPNTQFLVTLPKRQLRK